MSSLSSPRRDPNGEFPLARLTQKQRQFALFVSEGKSAQLAAKLAGYVSVKTTPQKMIRNPVIVKAIQHLQKRYENSIVASRKQVLEGFLEAIEQAKVLSDPAVQIAGWREIGRMCGYYAPEVKEVNVNVTAKRVINQLETLSDEALLEMIERDRGAIEGTATELLESPSDTPRTTLIDEASPDPAMVALDEEAESESESGPSLSPGAESEDQVGLRV